MAEDTSKKMTELFHHFNGKVSKLKEVLPDAQIEFTMGMFSSSILIYNSGDRGESKFEANHNVISDEEGVILVSQLESAILVLEDGCNHIESLFCRYK